MRIFSRIFRKQNIQYFQCKTCDFWLTSEDYFCPNCKSPVNFKSAQIALKFTLFLSSLSAIHIIFQGIDPNFNPYKISLAVLAGATSFTTIFAINKFSLSNLFAIDILPKKLKSSLCEDEEKIQQRLQEFCNRAKPILTAKERTYKIADDQYRAKISKALDTALSVLKVQRDRYRAKLWEIQLIRWHNRLKPIINSWQPQIYAKSSSESFEYFFEQLDMARDYGELMLHHWEETDLATIPEGIRHIQTLQTALSSCDLLYQEVVARQAAAAIEGISRFDEPRSSYETNLASEQLEVLNTLPDVTDFTFGLGDLETEYLRLQSEAELDQQWLNP